MSALINTENKTNQRKDWQR